MAATTFSFFNWNNVYTYAKWDVIYGATASDTRYFYSTTDNNVGADPNAQFVFSPTKTVRTENVMRVYFNQTGTTTFQPGSIVNISGIAPDSSANYSGTVLAVGALGPSGYVEYLNGGLDTTNAVTAGGVRAPIHPNWTTGFYWVPSYTTDASHDQAVVQAKLGDGYSQRQSFAINSNSLAWNLVFDERTNKETRALLNFLQDKGGATPFVMNLPLGGLYNKAGLQYVSQPAKHRMGSFGLNQVTVPVVQVFDIG